VVESSTSALEHRRRPRGFSRNNLGISKGLARPVAPPPPVRRSGRPRARGAAGRGSAPAECPRRPAERLRGVGGTSDGIWARGRVAGPASPPGRARRGRGGRPDRWPQGEVSTAAARTGRASLRPFERPGNGDRSGFRESGPQPRGLRRSGSVAVRRGENHDAQGQGQAGGPRGPRTPDRTPDPRWPAAPPITTACCPLRHAPRAAALHAGRAVPEDGSHDVIGGLRTPARRASAVSSIGVPGQCSQAISFLPYRLRTNQPPSPTGFAQAEPVTLRPAPGPGWICRAAVASVYVMAPVGMAGS